VEMFVKEGISHFLVEKLEVRGNGIFQFLLVYICGEGVRCKMTKWQPLFS